MPGDAPVELLWSKVELEAIFGSLSGRKAWHRLEERLSKLNQDGKRHGVRMSAVFDEGNVTLSARSEAGLAEFRGKLDRAPGRVQRAFGTLIRSRQADGGPQALSECLVRQRDEVVRTAREPLRLFSALAPISGNVFIDPPYRFEGGAAKARGALEAVLSETAAAGKGTLLILGPSGIGKSTLAGEAFRRLRLAPAASWSHPLFVPASDFVFTLSGEVDWERVPGVPVGLGARLDALFKEGRLLFFLDGLDENVRLMDLSNPAIWSFWGMASRNRCIVTCRDRFYNLRFSCSPVERIFGGGLKVMHLPYWGAAQAKALYGAISEMGRGALQARALVDGLGHLSRLSPETLREKMASFQLTGLTAWNFAIFFALHNGGKFPRNEYEILDYFVDQSLRWEKGKTRQAEPLPLEVLRGLLVHLGRIADGDRNGRKTWRITPDAIIEVAGKYYPDLLDRKNDLFTALRQIPFLEYEAESGAFHLDYNLGCFFAAKNIIAIGIEGDSERLRQEFQTTVSLRMDMFLVQAFSAFDDDAKSRFFETGRKMFEESKRLFAEDRAQIHLQCMCEILELLGRLRWPAAERFFRAVADKKEGYSELINLTVARALAHSGDCEAVDAYIRRLKRDPSARQANRNYYLLWLWPAAVKPVDNYLKPLRPAVLEDWERVSRGFVNWLSGDHYSALRHIQLFSFADLLRTMGPANLDRELLRSLASKLKRESSAWTDLARADLRDFTRMIERLYPA